MPQGYYWEASSEDTGRRFFFLQWASIVVIGNKNKCSSCYIDYLSCLQLNPLFYVAVLLDPTAKQGPFYESMERDEFTIRMSEISMFMKNYQQAQKFNSNTGQRLEQESTSNISRKNNNLLSFNIHKSPYPLEHVETDSTQGEGDNESLKNGIDTTGSPQSSANPDGVQ